MPTGPGDDRPVATGLALCEVSPAGDLVSPEEQVDRVEVLEVRLHLGTLLPSTAYVSAAGISVGEVAPSSRPPGTDPGSTLPTSPTDSASAFRSRPIARQTVSTTAINTASRTSTMRDVIGCPAGSGRTSGARSATPSTPHATGHATGGSRRDLTTSGPRAQSAGTTQPPAHHPVPPTGVAQVHRCRVRRAARLHDAAASARARHIAMNPMTRRLCASRSVGASAGFPPWITVNTGRPFTPHLEVRAGGRARPHA
jgi:hypothetical protein